MLTARISLFVVLLILCIFSRSAVITQTVYTGEFTPQAVVPFQTDTGGTGVAVCVYDRNASPKTIDCEGQFNLDSSLGPFFAGIYRGKPTANGPLLFDFQDQIISNFRQVFQIQDIIDYYGESYSAQAQEEDFLNGRWYIAITSSDYEFGAIRANLLHEHFMYSRLENNNIIPTISDSSVTSHGLLVGKYSYFDPFKTAQFALAHEVSGAIRAGIYEGDERDIGTAEYIFSSAGTFRETVSYSTAMEDHLLTDDQYFQIDSVLNTNGEVRGEMRTIDQVPPVAFTARFSGTSVLPRVVTLARGCGIFSLDCHTLELEYVIYHNVGSPTLAWMNLGDSYNNGVKLWPLARAKGPIYGSRILTADEVIALYQDRMYVTVESLVYPDGEIRGQISDTYNYYAYLTGTQLLPPVTTSGIGCGTFRLNEITNEGRVFDYDVNFSIPDFDEVSIDLVHGDKGLSGETLYNLGHSFNVVSGSSVTLSTNEADFVGTEKTYVQIGDTTLNGNGGMLRGQILRIVNPCPFVTTIQEHNANSPTSSWEKYDLPEYIEWNGEGSSLTPLLSLLVLTLCVLLL